MPTRQAFVKPPRLVRLYFGLGHVAVTLALLALALDPRAAAGFFYHARMVAIVHLVTLGWLTSSLLGSLYMAAPTAFGTPLAIQRLDYTAFALVVIGIVGMVTHFWMASFAGMAWSAATVATGVFIVVARVSWLLRRSPLPRRVTRPIFLASLNLGIAATMGVLLGFDKADQFLPGFVLTNVFAHAHMAALGWATLMALGVAARLLPASPPIVPVAPRMLAAGTVLLEVGVVGLFISLLRQSSWSLVFGICAIGGVGALTFHLAISLVGDTPRAGVPPPGTNATMAPDAAQLHAYCALVWLLVAAALGGYLLWQPLTDMTLRAALAYGTVGLLGFLGQLVLAIRVRLLHHGSDRRQSFVLAAWVVGVAGIALGLAADQVTWLVGGALVMLPGVLLDAALPGAVLDAAPRGSPGSRG